MMGTVTSFLPSARVNGFRTWFGTVKPQLRSTLLELLNSFSSYLQSFSKRDETLDLILH